MIQNLVWLSHDLRLYDNPALWQACANGPTVTIAFDPNPWITGQAQQCWYHQSLQQLAQRLAEQNIACYIVSGPWQDMIVSILQNNPSINTLWMSDIQPAEQKLIQTHIQHCNVACSFIDSNHLQPLGTMLTQQQTPFKIYTPFKNAMRRCLSGRRQAYPVPKQSLYHQLSSVPEPTYIHHNEKSWHKKLAISIQAGEYQAWQRLKYFINHCLYDYEHATPQLTPNISSQLAPFIALGEISVIAIVDALEQHGHFDYATRFVDQLIWREFCHQLYYHFPNLTQHHFKSNFDAFPWRDDPDFLKAWQYGKTGFPIIDAAMRQLWETGYMPNRLRMVVASFLTKNGLIHWQYGANWFMDTLFDADTANNAANWQWVAGSGTDAAPYFRIFNPLRQAQQFDPKGAYVRQWLPILKNIPDQMIHTPWVLTSAQKAQYQCQRYPDPIIDLKTTRQRALSAYEMIKSK